MSCVLNTAVAAPCGTLVIPNAIGQGDPSAVTSLNPLVGSGSYNQESALLLYRPLIWVGQDGTADADRSLAQSVASADGGTRFVVALKPWRWSDGVPVTADDVIYSWELIHTLGNAFAYYGQGGIPDRVAAVRALDPHHVEFRMNGPTNQSWFSLVGLAVLPALPRHAWGSLSRDELWQRQTDPALFQVVDGPFKLESFRPDQAISYVPNPLYGGHQASVARLVIDFLEGGSALHALRAGDVDMAQVPLPLWDHVRTLPGLVPVTLPEPFGYLSLTFNLHRDRVAFLQDARVRRALTDAADQKTMIRLVYDGASTENRVPVPSDPATFRSPAVQAGHLPVRYDVALAKAELDAAGWRPGRDGVRVRDGQRLEFTVLYSGDVPERLQLLQILQQDYRRIGIIIHLHAMSYAQLAATFTGPSGDWDAVLIATTLTGWPDGTSYFNTGGGQNMGGYSDPAMDSAIKDSTSKAGLEALYRYQDIFAAEQPVNILPQGAVRLLVSPRVRGLADFVNPQNFLSPEYLSVAGPECPGNAPGGP